MVTIHLKYLSHIMLITGKKAETIDFEGETIEDLLVFLDKKYPGIKSLFNPMPGILNTRTMIHLIRKSETAKAILDLKFTLQEGDILSLW